MTAETYSPTNPRYPEIEVQLTGNDGNAIMILGRVSAAMRQGGVAQGQIEMFRSEALAGDYAHLLRTCKEWVSAE